MTQQTAQQVVFTKKGVSCSNCRGGEFHIRYEERRNGQTWNVYPVDATCKSCGTVTRAMKSKILRLEGGKIMEWTNLRAAHGRTAEAVRTMMRRCLYEFQ